MRGIVVANGTVAGAAFLGGDVRPDDLVICADGGVQNALRLGLQPGIVVGDFDSAPPDLADALRRKGIRFIEYSTRKNETDAELALRLAVEQGVDEIVFLGALGGRLDHALANLLLLAAPEFARVPITVVDDGMTIRLCRDRCTLSGRPGDIVSLLPLGGDVEGVVTRGLEYPLRRETLKFGLARGVSNVMLETVGEVKVSAGILAVFHLPQASTGDRPEQESEA